MVSNNVNADSLHNRDNALIQTLVKILKDNANSLRKICAAVRSAHWSQTMIIGLGGDKEKTWQNEQNSTDLIFVRHLFSQQKRLIFEK